MSHKKISRRALLGYGAAIAGASMIKSPMELLYDSLVQGIIQKAAANDSGIQPRRLLDIQEPGAPSRWTFDLFLDPLKTGVHSVNPSVGTRYVAENGEYVGVEYRTIDRFINGRTVQLPWLWQFDVPSANGGMRPMTELLSNLMSISGINTGNPGHAGSRGLQFRPAGAVQSISALSGDYSNAPFPNVNVSASNFQFKSIKGKTSVIVQNGGYLLEKLLSPFNSANLGSYDQKKDNLQLQLDRSLASLNLDNEATNEKADSLSQSIYQAENLIEQGFSDFPDFWDRTFAKYQSLILRALDRNYIMEGINDLPIGTSGARDHKYQIRDIVVQGDLRDIVTPETRIGRIAEHFTLAEYVLTRNLSYSVSISNGGFQNLSFNGDSTRSASNDEHREGCMPMILLNSYRYRAIAACLLEMMDQLKAANIFDETVIRYGGEFNRSPRLNGSGSDHGFRAASTALYSGAIQGPIFLGNQKDSIDENYPGSWGVGAPIDGVGEINLGHVASTLAALLRVPSPVTAAGSLIDASYRPIYGETQKKEGV